MILGLGAPTVLHTRLTTRLLITYYYILVLWTTSNVVHVQRERLRRGVASDWKVSEYNDDERGVDKGKCELDSEEDVQVLPMRRGDLVTPDEAKGGTTPSGDTEGRPNYATNGVS